MITINLIKNKKMISFFAVIIVLGSILSGAALAGSSGTINAATELYLVGFEHQTLIIGILKGHGVDEAAVKHWYMYMPVVLVELTHTQAFTIERDFRVVFIDKNVEVFAAQNQGNSWGASHFPAADAYSLNYKGDGINVAVLDTGIAYHDDLNYNVRGGMSVIGDDPRNDVYGHGTHVAGIIRAVAPNSNLYAVQVLDNNGRGTVAGVIKGIEWARSNGAHVINMGLAGSSGSSALRAAADNAYAANIVVIAAAGNGGNSWGTGDNVGFPARHTSVIAVAAVDSDNRRPSFSSTGPSIEISAPGVNINSTLNNSSYGNMDGTSMAAAHVAGVAALIKQASPASTPSEIRKAMNDTALHLGTWNWYGHGLVRPADAINSLSDLVVLEPSINVEKFVSPDGGSTWFDADTSPGPSIPHGTNPVFRFVVTNTGNVALRSITLEDTVLGPITIPTTILARGNSFTVEVTGTWQEGQQGSLVEVTGFYDGEPYTDFSPVHYVGVVPVLPSIEVEMIVSPDGSNTWFDANTPPGPSIPQGTSPVFRFVVTNTGNVTLDNVALEDTVLGPITIPITTLAPGETFTVEVTGTWQEGQQANVATVTGDYEGVTHTDTDLAHYVGVVPGLPAIEVEMIVSPDGGNTWFDADTSPGPSIPQGSNPVFRFVVTNTGNVNLDNITLEDSVLGPITIPTTTLAPEENLTVEVTGTWQEGQQTNVATVTGDYEGVTHTDTDPAHYVGVVPELFFINVEKFVSPDGGNTWFDADTSPGPSVPQGTSPVFRIVVTNVGNVTLKNITLEDSVLGPTTISSLGPGENLTVEVTGTWAEGQQTNVATVTGDYEGVTHTDTDSAHYFGLPYLGVIPGLPSIDVEKFVSLDGGTTWFDADTPPGLSIPQGTDPVFRFIVTNTGTVTLESISLVDSILGPITIPTTTLAPGESFTVEVTDTWTEGQQTNDATVTGDYQGVIYNDTDSANYVGVIPAIDVEKFASPDGGDTWFDANTPPGPSIPQGTDPVFRFVVTNTGTVTLDNITLEDSVLGPITIPTTTLAPGESITVEVTGTWVEGQQLNSAIVTGVYEGNNYTGSYFGRDSDNGKEHNGKLPITTGSMINWLMLLGSMLIVAGFIMLRRAAVSN